MIHLYSVYGYTVVYLCVHINYKDKLVAYERQIIDVWIYLTEYQEENPRKYFLGDFWSF